VGLRVDGSIDPRPAASARGPYEPGAASTVPPASRPSETIAPTSPTIIGTA